MKKNIFLPACILILAFVISNCAKDTNTNQANDSSLKTEFVNPYDYIGVAHNTLLYDWLENNNGVVDTNFISDTNFEFIVSKVTKKPEFSNVPNCDWTLLSDRIAENDSSIQDYALLLFSQRKISLEQKTMLLTLDTIVGKAEIDFEECKAAIHQFDLSISTSTLSEDERKLLYITSSVCLHSLTLWNDAYYNVNNPYHQIFASSQLKTPWWFRLGMVDACGAGIGFVMGGLGGAVIGGVGCSAVAAAAHYIS